MTIGLSDAQRANRRATQRRYYERNRARIIAACNAGRAEYKRRWAAENKERVLEAKRRYYDANKAKVIARTAARRKADPSIRLTEKAQRRAAEKAAVVPLTADERARVKSVYATAKKLKALTGAAYDVDHIVPLARGGLHHPDNLRVIRASDNRRKAAKLPHEVNVEFEIKTRVID